MSEDRFAGHTPGPWRCDERVGCVAVYPGDRASCLSGASGREIHFAAGERGTNERGQIVWSVSKEKVANARLIAEAWRIPELEAEIARLRAELAAAKGER